MTTIVAVVLKTSKLFVVVGVAFVVAVVVVVVVAAGPGVYRTRQGSAGQGSGRHQGIGDPQ